MEIKTLILLVIAAFIHSIWNLIAKKSIDKQVFLWLGQVSISILFLIPFCILFKNISTEILIIIVISGCLEGIYYFLLGKSYENGDLSQVYPLARGSAPVFITLAATFLFKEPISYLGYIGIGVIIFGIYTVNLKALHIQELIGPIKSLKQNTSQLAIMTGFIIACYSLVDKYGVSVIRANPYSYIYLVFLVSAIVLTPYMLNKKLKHMKVEWKLNKFRIIVVAVFSVLAYVLALVAMASNNVSYVAAVREMSIIFAAILGTLFLKEPFAKMKIVGATFIFCGIFIIAIA